MDESAKSDALTLTEALRELAELKKSYAECRAEWENARKESETSLAHARAAQEELNYFVYAASHDLQAPLRVVNAYAQLLQREYPDQQQAKEFTNFIIDSARQMLALVRDLLTYSRSGAIPQLRTLNLNSPLQSALFTLAALIRSSEAQVSIDPLPEVAADERQLTTVFESLISNALKYRREPPPQIKVSAEESDNSQIISIEDNGEGVPPEHHEMIFEPFKRLHGKEIPGSGLGLAICRKIVRAHNGHLWIESDGKAGSKLKFTIPV